MRRILGLILLASLGTACQDTTSNLASLSSLPSLEGKILEASTQNPIEDATVTIGESLASVQSNPKGHYILPKLPAGSYSITVSHPRYLRSVYSNVPIKDGETGTLNVQLRPGFEIKEGHGLLEGSLKSPGGELMAYATIQGIGSKLSFSTDASGRFAIHIKEGNYHLYFNSPDDNFYDYDLKDLKISAGEVFHIDLILSPKMGPEVAFVGSEQCQSCHGEISERHRVSLHGKSYQPVGPDGAGLHPSALAAFQESRVLNLRPVGPDGNVRLELTIEDRGPVMKLFQGTETMGALELPVVATLGGQRWQQLYVTTIGDKHYILPAQFNLDQDGDPANPAYQEGWVGYRIEDWFTRGGMRRLNPVTGSIAPAHAVEKNCLKCHSTGPALSIETTEMKIGCESCHGAGGLHTSAPEDKKRDAIENPVYRSYAEQLESCGRCHFGDEMRDRADKKDFLTGVHATGTVKLSCVVCHEAHGSTGQASQLKQSVDNNALCLSCHTGRNFPNTEALKNHIGTSHPIDPDGATGSGRCVSCHWPKTGRVAQYNHLSGVGDASAHGGRVIAPRCEAFDLAAGETLPEGQAPIDSCLECHGQNQFLAEAGILSFSGFSGHATDSTYCEIRQERYAALFEGGRGSPHPTEGWKGGGEHGQVYLRNPKTCMTSCHGVDLQGGRTGGLNDGPSCISCHIRETGTAFPHQWSPTRGDPGHHGVAANANLESCKTCHGTNLSGGNTRVNCTSCHNQESHPEFEPTWRSTHGQEYKTSPSSCRSCHGNNLQGTNLSGGVGCGDCHEDYPHPEGWAKRPFSFGANKHRKVLTEGRLEDCQLCHGADYQREVAHGAGESVKTCYDCHTYPHSAEEGWSDSQHGLEALNTTLRFLKCGPCHISSAGDWSGGSGGRMGHGTSCYSCHPNFPHKEDWARRLNHGAEARGEFQTPADSRAFPCSTCHGDRYAGGVSEVACSECHEAFPGRHEDESWVHGEDLELADCADCHMNWLGSPFSPIFPDTWPELPLNRPEETTTGNPTCFACHTSYPHTNYAGRSWAPLGHQFYIANAGNNPASCSMGGPNACHGAGTPSSRRKDLGLTSISSRAECRTCHEH